MAVAYEVKEGVIRIDARGWAIEPSIEDSEACMGIVVNILKEVKAPEKLIISATRDIEYDYPQLKLLIEIVDAQKKILEEEKLLSTEKFGPSECEVFFPGRLAELNFIISEVLRKDPVRAYFTISRKIKGIKIGLKGASPAYRRCATYYLTNVLEPMEKILSGCQIIATAKPFLPTYRPGDRRIYRELFHPTIRPPFMLTSFKLVIPKEARLLDKYQIDKILVEVYRVPGGVRDLYYVTAPEFKLSSEEYSILDVAYRTLVARRPPEEITEPERAREVFFSMGVDLIKDISSRMGIELTPAKVEELARILVRYTAGFGILELLLADGRVQDVYINSPIGLTPVYIVHSDFEECETNLIPTKDDAEAWATRFRLYSGRPLDEANPVLDTELTIPGGRARVCAITRPLSPAGLAFSFRRHRERPWTFPLFTKVKMIDPFFSGLMNFIVQGGRSILIAGGRASGKCVGGDTLVQLANGEIKPIKEVVENTFNVEDPISLENDEIAIPTNLEVLALGEDLKIRPSKVAAVWRRRAPEELIRVVTSAGKEIKTTPEHPYFTIKDGNIEKIRADQLTRGTRIALPKKISLHLQEKSNFTLFDLPDNCFLQTNEKLLAQFSKLGIQNKNLGSWIKTSTLKNLLSNPFNLDGIEKIKGFTSSGLIKLPKIDENFMSFLGYLFGDGHLDKGGISFFNSNKIVRNEFTKLCKEVFGIEGKEEFPKNRTAKVSIRSRVLVRFLNNLGIPTGKKADTIKLPGRFLRLENDKVKHFLRAYFSCDANVSKNSREIEFSTASKAMAKQIEWLLLRFDIFSFFGVKKVGDKEYYRILIRGEDVNKFASFVGFSHPSKSRRLEHLLRKSWKHGIYDVIPGVEDAISRLVKCLRIKLSREARRYIKPVVHEKRRWLVTREKLKKFVELFERKLEKIEKVKDDFKKIREYKNSFSNIEKLIDEIGPILKSLKISYSEIAREIGKDGKYVEIFFKKKKFSTIELAKKILSAAEGKISHKLVEVNPTTHDLPRIIKITNSSYAEMGRYLGVHETTVRYYISGKGRKEKKEKIKNYIQSVSQEWNKKVKEVRKKLPVLKEILNSVKAVDVASLIKKIIREVEIEKEELATLANTTPYSISRIEVARLKTVVRVIEGLEKILEEMTSQDLVNLLNKLKLLANSDIFFDKVEVVERIKPEEPYVYDLTVDGCQNFLANGFIAHNTSLLNALMLEILRKHRIVVIEDTLEIAVDLMRKLGYNIERMKTRSVITRVETELPAEEALRTGLRLGESVLIVGEVRGSIRGSEEVVVVEDGIMKRVKIEDLENKDVKNYKIPTLGFDLKMKLSPLASFVKHPKKHKLIKITTKTGRNVTITPNHSLFTATRDFRIAAIMCNKLKVGDQIVIPARMPCGFNDINELNLLEILPEFRLENFETWVKKAIRKLGWKEATKIAGVTSGDIYNYFRAKKTYLPIESFKKLMQAVKITYSPKKLFIRKGTSKKLPAVIPVNEEFCRFLGYYVSEGYYSFLPNGGGCVVITNSDEKIVKDIIRIGKKVFKTNPTVRVIKGLGKSKQIKFSSLPLTSLISKLECGRISNEKRIPPIIYGLSKKRIAEFLKGLYTGDGHFDERRNAVEYSTTSKLLAEDLLYLLSVFGIVAEIKEEKRKHPEKPIWKVEFKDRKMVEIFLKEISFVQIQPVLHKKSWPHSRSSMIYFDKDELKKHFKKYPRKYRHLFRFERCSKNYLERVVGDDNCEVSEQLKTFANGDFFLDKIKKIEEISLNDPEHVYDLSVNPTQNFVGGFGGILLHNTEALALFEAMRIGALANVVAGTIHAESPYGVYDRIVHDLGVPPTSFKACDLIVICSMLRSPDGLHRFRRVIELTEVRKAWKEDPEAEGGFVPLLQYSAKEDRLKPTDVLIDGESWVLNEIAKRVREWHGAWDLVWDNILLRSRVKETMLDFALKLNRPDILEADWNVESNEMFHIISERVRTEVGALDSEMIYQRWLEWFKKRLR